MGTARVLLPAFVLALATAVLIFSGLLPLTYVAGLPTGGVLDTGQAEPLRWLFAAMVLTVVASLVWRRTVWPWLYSASYSSAVAAVCCIAGSHVSPGKVLLFAASTFSVAGAVHFLRHKKWWSVGVAMLLLFASIALLMPRPVVPDQSAYRVGVMSALPLFWREGASAADLLYDARDQAFVDASTLPLEGVDALDAEHLARYQALLLAQPRVLASQELVALDTWVRAGGHLVVLADPKLEWPSALPLGHRLRPPMTSLLDPLMTHWGLMLEPVSSDGEGVLRHLLPGGQVMMSQASSHFTLMGKQGCSLEQGGLMAVCTIGNGQARWIADADMLDDRLWLARKGAKLRLSDLSADTVTLIEGWLLNPASSPSVSGINRVHDEAHLMAGLRWAMAIGLVWAVLGFWLCRRKQASISTLSVSGKNGTPRE